MRGSTCHFPQAASLQSDRKRSDGGRLCDFLGRGCLPAHTVSCQRKSPPLADFFSWFEQGALDFPFVNFLLL